MHRRRDAASVRACRRHARVGDRQSPHAFLHARRRRRARWTASPTPCAAARRWAWSASPAAARASPRCPSCGSSPARPGGSSAARSASRARDLLALTESRDGGHPRQRHLDDLPGADDLAQSAAHGRAGRSARRSRCTRDCRAARRMDQADRHAAPRAHPGTGAARARLSAPDVRRHAPARDDRHGAVVQSARC